MNSARWGGGQHVLGDRLWPHGIAKNALPMDLCLKDVAASRELCRWFGHAPACCEEFPERSCQTFQVSSAEAAVATLAQRAAASRLILIWRIGDAKTGQSSEGPESILWCAVNSASPVIP
ncbi:MAG: DUF488 family protein [Chloroflexi bacterium]|nr:DUF488 family protein [Chloroflexota bacterium]